MNCSGYVKTRYSKKNRGIGQDHLLFILVIEKHFHIFSTLLFVSSKINLTEIQYNTYLTLLK